MTLRSIVYRAALVATALSFAALLCYPLIDASIFVEHPLFTAAERSTMFFGAFGMLALFFAVRNLAANKLLDALVLTTAGAGILVYVAQVIGAL